MKIFKRLSDGFEVQDAKDRSIEWASEKYGGEFMEVVIPTPTNPRIAEIDAELAEIDRKSVRPLRNGESTRLYELETQASSLRAERAGLILIKKF